MITFDVVQGSQEWLELRANYDTASEAPTMMGFSPYMSRSALMRQKKTGGVEEVGAHKQALFDRGHAAELSARVIVEEAIGEELFPITGVNEQNGLLASFDGLTMGGKTGYEHKLWNESVAAQVRSGNLGPEYYWQLEQQLLLSGAEKIIFVCSDGTPEKFLSMEYRAGNGRAEQLRAGWKQFREDLAVYQPVEVLPAAVAEPVMALPALSIQVNGAISLISNLDAFGRGLKAFVAGLNTNPSDDQAFADAELAVKTLKRAEDALEAAKASALGQTASIDEMTRTVALYADLARTNRLMLEKLVKARKESIRVEIRQAGNDAFALHVANLNKRLGAPYLNLTITDFAGVMRGMKTVASLRNAVDTELARAKIEANAIADRIQINLATLQELAGEHQFLFADSAQIVLKANDDLIALVKLRIAYHKVAEDKRLEAERAEEQVGIRQPMQQATSSGHSAVLSSPAPKPKVVSTATGPRPTDADIIRVLANHYHVSDEKVIFWISQMSTAQKQSA